MYTCCPECGTTFRVTAEQLGVARGDVRCGSCGIAFNALESLQENVPDPGPSDIEPSDADDSTGEPASLEFDAPESTWGNIFLEGENVVMEGGEVEEDEVKIDLAGIDRSAPPQATGFDLESETGDPEEWEALLAEVEDEDTPAFGFEPESLDETTPGEHLAAVEDADVSDELAQIEAPAEDLEVPAELPEIEAPAEQSEAADELLEADAEGQGLEETPQLESAESELEAAADEEIFVEEPEEETPTPWFIVESEPSTAAPPDWPAATGTDSAEPVLTDVPPWLAGKSPEPATTTEGRGSLGTGWIAGCVLLLIILGIQLVHGNRDALASHPSYGATVRALYGRLGVGLYPAWKLTAYEVRGSEAVAGRTQSDALDILARVEVRGSQPVGMPLIRLVLQDRWSNTVASRVFTPQEYVVNLRQVPDIVGPGTKIPVHISVLDPGAEAQGYMVDVCLPRRYSGLQCQNTLSPFQP